MTDTAAADSTGLEIAIIGKAGRFPGASSIATFWQNLREGIESISVFSEEELLAAGVDPAQLALPQYVRANGRLGGADLFDAAFFGYSPREAEIMDPQHRVFLECAWEALEDAGYDPSACPGLVGVYGGAGLNTYVFSLLSQQNLLRVLGGQQLAISNGNDFLCTRVSYKLNLEGPSVVVQSACSTSLVAVHLACRGLLAGECDLALAGGVSISFPQESGYLFQEGGTASPDGHCRAFDARARGVVSGSGVGLVVLKPLDRALADGNSIAAVIRGSAINNDGSTKAGYTAPRVEGQAAAIQAAQMMAEVPPETITYVETHGTATRVGDPIEIAALTHAFRAGTAKRGFCAVGSVKTNIGHLDAAAGVASLLKTVLALEHKEIPPSLHFETPNPEIDFAASPFYVNHKLASWPEGPTPRRAGVSSFGLGGTNAHLILEEAPACEVTPTGRPWQLLVLSARSGPALETATANLAAHLRAHPDLDLSDVAFTLQAGRKAFDVRRAIVCRDREEALRLLERGGEGRLTGMRAAERGGVAFLLSGLGDHYVGMAEGLYRDEPVFREQLDLCSELLAPHLGLDLRRALYPDRPSGRAEGEAPDRPGPDLRRMLGRPAAEPVAHAGEGQILRRTGMAQPALFAVEYALAQLWMSWGIRPQALLGYSLGEYLAACLAGVVSLSDALALVAQRAHLVESLPESAMLAVSLSEEETLSRLGPDLSLCAVNAPSVCVVGGPLAAVADFESRLAAKGGFSRRLQTSHAFHSRAMEPIASAFRDLVASFPLNPPEIPYVSNVTGTWMDPGEAVSPDYWVRHLCQTVRFADGLQTLLQKAPPVLLEVGPGRALGHLALQQPRREPADTGPDRLVLSSLPHDYDRQPAQAVTLASLGRLWISGALDVDWAAVHAGERRRRVPLPTYPFERRRFWVGAGTGLHPMRPAPSDPEVPGPVSEVHGEDEDRAPTAIEREIAAVWGELLGIPRVGLRDNFFELGGSSLLAVGLGSRLERKLGVQLPPELLLQSPTVAGMAERIAEKTALSPEQPGKPLWGKCLVEIQKGSRGRQALYLVHPIGGHLYLYRNLAPALGEDQPVYGFRAEGLEEGEHALGSIEDIAAHYIEVLLSFQPEGPFLLGGSSLGGLVAFEMALQLRRRGKRVDLLALLDAPGPGQMPPRPSDEADVLGILFGDWLPISIDHLRELDDFESRLLYLLEIGQNVKALPPDFDLATARRHVQVTSLLCRAMFDYQPQAYPGGLVFFRAQDRSTVTFANPELAWIELAEAGTETHVVPGGHTTMHDPPYVAILARRLRIILDRAMGVSHERDQANPRETPMLSRPRVGKFEGVART